ncbi:MAG: HAMP domain-containing protein [Betaproteobacteria bacterium]|nr:HAMP domain-containing protein [Betaproteobacteria bacterium]
MPGSLFGRLVLVLLGGLLLAQLATAYINLTERDQLLYRAGGMRLAQQISDIVKLLDSLPAAERRKVVAIFNAPPLSVSLDAPPIAQDDASSEADFQHSMFATVLRFALGEEAKIHVRRAEGAPVGVRPGGGFGPQAGPMMPHRMRGPGMQGYGAGGAFFTVQVALSDGTWVTFDSHVSPQSTATPLRVALTLLVLLVTVIVLSLVAVRWVTGPLSELALAAEKLGEDINRPPLPETGPIEVQRAAKAFNTMQQRLQRFISDRTRILTAMSHDLKTPITRMRLRTEMLEDDELRAKFERDLGEMESMVGQTLEFMRDTSASEAVQRVDLMALLESLQSDFRDMGKSVEIDGGLIDPYPGRPLALRRCFTNLLENAVRYGERAAIGLEESANEVTVRIRDAGPGIPAHELERSFEPFFRGEASRSRDTGGTGLGLGIARNIARAHGGDLVLENRAGGGLEAIVTLPRPAAGTPG